MCGKSVKRNSVSACLITLPKLGCDQMRGKTLSGLGVAQVGERIPERGSHDKNALLFPRLSCGHSRLGSVHSPDVAPHVLASWRREFEDPTLPPVLSNHALSFARSPAFRSSHDAQVHTRVPGLAHGGSYGHAPLSHLAARNRQVSSTAIMFRQVVTPFAGRLLTQHMYHNVIQCITRVTPR